MLHTLILTYVDHYQTSQQCRKKAAYKTFCFCSRNKPIYNLGRCALPLARFLLVKIASIYVDELIQKYQETNSLESFFILVCFYSAIESSSTSPRSPICFTMESVQTPTRTRSSRYRSRYVLPSLWCLPSGEI